MSDVETLTRAVLRPACPRLADARDAVEGVTDPQEAWERLAARDVIPLGWVQDPARAFLAPPRWAREDELDPAFEALLDGNGPGAFPAAHHPPTVDACVALASDPEGVATAEALAREVAARVGVVAARVVWRVTRRAWLVGAFLRRSGTPIERLSTQADRVVARVQRVVLAFARDDRDARSLDGTLRALAAHPATAATPRLLATGYALEGIAGDAVYLVAPT